MFKNKKLLFMLFTLACFISMGICIIVDMATSNDMTWSKIVLISILFGWFVISPVFFQKHQLILSLTVISVLTLPFLYFLEKVTPITNWFFQLGVPLYMIGIALMWILYLLFRFVKISLWYKSAISVLLVAVIASPIINQIVDNYIGYKSVFPNDLINVFTGITLSAVLAVVGYMKVEIKNRQ